MPKSLLIVESPTKAKTLQKYLGPEIQVVSSKGHIKDLPKNPGRNVTGFATMELSVISKMLQTLKEIAPNVTHISMIYNPDNPVGALFVRSF